MRYFDGAREAIAGLRAGSVIRLELEEHNAVNPKAVLVSTVDDHRFGYVPDWLCADICTRIKDGWDFSVEVDRVNIDARAHVRVLCRIDAQRP